MFGRIRALLSSTMWQATSAPRPARFCPSVECLGDRALPAAGLTADLGVAMTATASAGGESGATTTVPALVQGLDALDHALANDTLVRIGDPALASSVSDPTTTVRAVQTEMRAAIMANPQLGNALAHVAQDWRAGQGIAGTELGRAIQTEFWAVAAAHPLVGDTLAHVTQDWRTAQGLNGMGVVRAIQTEIKEVLINVLVRAVEDWRSSPHIREEIDDSASTTTPADREWPLSPPPSADISPVGWRAVFEVPSGKWAITLPGQDELAIEAPVPPVASNRNSTPAPGQPESPAPTIPLTTPNTEPVSREVDLITRFLPFDTAGLQEDVSDFLSDLESVVQVIPERSFPGVWESAAVITAGTGAVLAVGKWRACSTRTRLRQAGQGVDSAALTTKEPDRA